MLKLRTAVRAEGLTNAIVSVVRRVRQHVREMPHVTQHLRQGNVKRVRRLFESESLTIIMDRTPHALDYLR